MLGPILMMALGSIIFCVGATWYFWPTNKTVLVADEASTSAVGPLAGLTNAQLRERAISFAQTLRQSIFFAEYRELSDECRGKVKNQSNDEDKSQTVG